MVERFFRDLTDKRLRRGVFKNVPEVIHTINDYIAQHNKAPNPFVWTATAKDILEKVRRARAKLDMLQTARRTTLGFICGDLSGRFPSARRKAGQSKRRIIPIVMQRLITYIISDYHRIPLH